MLGWKPGDLLEMSDRKKALFAAYFEKMTKDPNWKQAILQPKIGGLRIG